MVLCSQYPFFLLSVHLTPVCLASTMVIEKQHLDTWSSPGVGNGNPLQYRCLETSTDRGAWRATVHGVAKSQTWLSIRVHVKKKKVKEKVTQSCPTLCDPMDYTVHGMLQARILEWVAVRVSRGIFPTQVWNPDLLHCRRILYQLSHTRAHTQGLNHVQIFPSCLLRVTHGNSKRDSQRTTLSWHLVSLDSKIALEFTVVNGRSYIGWLLFLFSC